MLGRLRLSKPTRSLHLSEITESVDGYWSSSAQADQPDRVDRPVRVVIAVPGLTAGGCERAVSLIVNAWAERGWDVTLITLERADAPPYFAIAPSVKIVRLGIPPDRMGPFRAAWLFANRVRLLRREFLRLSPDVVISFLTRMNIQSISWRRSARTSRSSCRSATMPRCKLLARPGHGCAGTSTHEPPAS